MTKREMVEAMMAGKVLESQDRNTAYFFDGNILGPFMLEYPDGKLERLLSWNGQWRIKQEPKKRIMTRNEVLGFITNTKGIVVRRDEDNEYIPAQLLSYIGYMENYEWATITKEGIIGDPKRFEIEE